MTVGSDEHGSDSTDWRETNAEAVGQTLATGAGLVAGAIVGGPTGAAAGAMAGPYATRAVITIANKYFPRRNESPTKMVQQAADELGIEPGELADRATSSEARLELSGEAIWAAWQTVNEQKIRALAMALANGLGGDDARVDEERLIVAALSSMEAPHIKLLRYLATDPYGREGVRDAVSLATIAHEREDFNDDTAGAVIATLERHHCVARSEVNVRRMLGNDRRMAALSGVPTSSGFGSPPEPTTFRVTAFGVHCLDYLGKEDPAV